MKLLYGTTNEGKLKSVRQVLSKIGVEVIGLNDLEGELPIIDENGEEPVDNARLKSMAYYKAFGIPVFSQDSGLYFIDEPHLTQPGTYVRRYTGKEMNDDELLEHYRQIAEDNGGLIKAQYINGISLVLDNDTIHDYQGEDISYTPFYISSVPHEKRVKGLPINTLSIEIETGEYFYDLVNRNRDSMKRNAGLIAFFKKHLNV